MEREELSENGGQEGHSEQAAPEPSPAPQGEAPEAPEAAPTLSLDGAEGSSEQEMDGAELLREINPGRSHDDEEEVELVEVSTTGRALGVLAFVIAAGTLAATALGYLPLGGIKEEQLPSSSITQEKIAPGAVGIDQISLEARDELAGPEGPRGPRGPKGDPGVGLGAVAIAEASVSPNREGEAEGEANCQKGKAIGGGAEIVQGSDEDDEAIVALTANSVLEKRAGWRASARSVQLRRGAGERQKPSWRLRIYALCAKPQQQDAQDAQAEEEAEQE